MYRNVGQAVFRYTNRRCIAFDRFRYSDPLKFITPRSGSLPKRALLKVVSRFDAISRDREAPRLPGRRQEDVLEPGGDYDRDGADQPVPLAFAHPEAG